MKRVLAIFLCLCLLFSTAACKPDNITYPTVITTPNAAETPENTDTPEEQPSSQETPSEEAEDPADQAEPSVNEPETPAEGTAETPAEEATDTPAEEPSDEADPLAVENGEEKAAHGNPLYAENFTVSTGVGSALSASGMISSSSPNASILKNRTIVLYTADSTPAFFYKDAQGHAVSEWEWMEALAAEQGFILKYSIKDKAVSLKAQRTALYAGQKLSLVQMTAEELGVGLSLTRSATAYLHKEMPSVGISNAVLTASNDTLFAPVGNVNALWYNTGLMPEGTDPAALSSANQWTVEQFKAVHSHAVSKSASPLLMEETLAWATLSGQSPLTLAEGKLDSNINAKATREVWSTLRTMNQELSTFVPVPDTAYTLAGGNVAMSYTAIPDAIKGITLQYATLPAPNAETPGTVTYTGTFFALPKYGANEESIPAALTFAELWCNRYTEVLAGKLQSLGIKGSAYEAYAAMAEQKGRLILHHPKIEALAEPYLKGLTDPAVDMDDAYEAIEDQINNQITVQNLYY